MAAVPPLRPFHNAQLDAFFTNGPQMALPAPIRIRLAAEGLQTMADFEDFKEDQLDQAFKICGRKFQGDTCGDE